MTDGEEASQSRRCAVIYNPTKISDKFRALVEEGLQQKGWGNTLWLETSVEDPGGAITKQSALSADALAHTSPTAVTTTPAIPIPVQ